MIDPLLGASDTEVVDEAVGGDAPDAEFRLADEGAADEGVGDDLHDLDAGDYTQGQARHLEHSAVAVEHSVPSAGRFGDDDVGESAADVSYCCCVFL